MKISEYFIDRKLKSTWQSPYKEIPKTEVEASWRTFKDRIAFEKERKNRELYYKISGAVAVMLIAFMGYFFLNIYNPSIHIANNSSGDKEITLPDGSLVLLKENSEIRYRERFEDLRGVKLKGEAFFNVAKDSLRAFKVMTNASTTTALGTSFNVDEKVDSEDVKISLHSGKVLISVKGKAESWTITPGESFVYEKGETIIEEFDADFSFDAGNEFIDVNNVELVKVLKFLEERFDHQFEKDFYAKKKRVTLRINKSDSLKQILEILLIINNTNYDLKKTTKNIQISREKKSPPRPGRELF